MRKLTRNRRKAKKVKLEPEDPAKPTEPTASNDLILCRVCESTEELIDIYWEPNAHFREKLRLISCLSEEDDPVSLLKFICQSCGERLQNLSSFRTQCEITYKKLLGEIAKRAEETKTAELSLKQESSGNSLKHESIEESAKDMAEEGNSDDQNDNSWTDDCSRIKTADQDPDDPDIPEPYQEDVQDPDTPTEDKEEESSDKKKWLQCRICKIRVKNRYHMEKHQWKHKGRSLKCTFCQIEYSCQGNLTRHIRVVHEKRRGHVCNICGKTFSQSNNLKLHLLVHQDVKFDCDECEKSFKNPRSLRNHKIMHIPVEDRPERIQKRIGKRSNITPWKTKQRCQKKMCICPTCGKISNYVTQHESHMRSHTGEKPFKCAHCSRTFRERNTLRSHLLLHTGEKPYSCSTCGAAFRQSAHLRRHIRSHTGEKPYKCLVCEKSFTEKSILTTHMRVHTGEKPFHCRLCPKKFHNARVLRRHYPKVHFKNQDIHTQSDIQRKLAAMQVDVQLMGEEEIN